MRKQRAKRKQNRVREKEVETGRKLGKVEREGGDVNPEEGAGIRK